MSVYVRKRVSLNCNGSMTSKTRRELAIKLYRTCCSRVPKGGHDAATRAFLHPEGHNH